MIHYFQRGCFVSKHVMQIIQKTVVGDQKKHFLLTAVFSFILDKGKSSVTLHFLYIVL